MNLLICALYYINKSDLLNFMMILYYLHLFILIKFIPLIHYKLLARLHHVDILVNKIDLEESHMILET